MKILCVLSRYAYGKPERGENYDYVHFVAAFERMGHEVEFFDSGDRSLYGDFADLNVALLERVASLRPDVRGASHDELQRIGKVCFVVYLFGNPAPGVNYVPSVKSELPPRPPAEQGV